MKRTLSTSDIAHELMQDTNAGWSWEAAKAIAEYLENYKEDTGEEMELDIVAIRCDYDEYPSALDCVKDCGYDAGIDSEDSEEDQEAAALEYLHNNTQVIEFAGGIVIQQF